MEIYAYAAGIIDGEGAVSIVERTRQPRNTFILTIQVSMKVPVRVPKWLLHNFGGNYGEYGAGGHAYGSGYQAKWTLFGSDARDFLRLIQPYIIEKLDIVNLALEFPISNKGLSLTDEGYEAQKAICDLIRQLNPKSSRRI